MNNHESVVVIEKSVRLKLKEKLAINEEKYGDSGNNKEYARRSYLAPMLMNGYIYECKRQKYLSRAENRLIPKPGNTYTDFK